MSKLHVNVQGPGNTGIAALISNYSVMVDKTEVPDDAGKVQYKQSCDEVTIYYPHRDTLIAVTLTAASIRTLATAIDAIEKETFRSEIDY